MKIEMTNKKEANCKVQEMTKKQNKTEMAFSSNRWQFYKFLMTRYLNFKYKVLE